MIGGGALTVAGLRRGGMLGFLLTLGGGYLAQRGLSGHCGNSIVRSNQYRWRPEPLHGYSYADEVARDLIRRPIRPKANAPSPKNRRASVTHPVQAEGDRETVEADLHAKSGTQES